MSREEVVVGAVLAVDVVDRSGRVLLRAGNVLGERHLHTLQTWGVSEVQVEDSPGSGAAPDLPQEVDEGIRERFRHNDAAHPLIAELLRRNLRRAARS